MTKSIPLSSFAVLALAKLADAYDSGWHHRQTTTNCSTIMEIICDVDNNLSTDTFCEAVEMAGLDLDTETWTVFAPVNDAFHLLPDTIVEDMLDGDDPRGLIDLLAYHTAEEKKIMSTDLKCDTRIFMSNEEFSVTICEGDKTFQVGLANPTSEYPQIITADIEACNSYHINTINKVDNRGYLMLN